MTVPTLLDGLLDDDPPAALPTTTLARPEADAPTMSAASPNPDDKPGPAMPLESPETPTTAGEKLVIVEGQRFIVDAGVDNETIRQHLIRQGFAGLAGAEIRTGTAQQDGRILATVDFIKKAGTKG